MLERIKVWTPSRSTDSGWLGWLVISVRGIRVKSGGERAGQTKALLHHFFCFFLDRGEMKAGSH